MPEALPGASARCPLGWRHRDQQVLEDTEEVSLSAWRGAMTRNQLNMDYYIGAGGNR